MKVDDVEITYLHDLVYSLAGSRVLAINSYIDVDYGAVLEVTADLSAREALELWLRIARFLKQLGYPIIPLVRWRGVQDVSEDKLVNYIVRITLELNLRPKALPGFDAVKLIREERGG